MPRVFLICQPSIRKDGSMPDLKPLAEHGEVILLVHAGDRPTFSPSETKVLQSRIIEKLRDFDPNQDFLVWAGGDTLCAVMTGVALERLEFNRVRWLRYDRGRDPATGRRTDANARYVPVEYPLHEGAPST